MATTPLTSSTVLKDRLVLGAVALASLVLVATACFLFGGAGTEKESKSTTFTHIHCSACSEELPYNPQLVNQACPNCDKGGTYVPTIGSMDEGGGSDGSFGRMVMFLILATVLLQGVAYVAVLRLRMLREADEAHRKRVLIGRCPFCKRKIGFPAAKEGEGIICPRCKTGFLAVPMDELIGSEE